MEQTLLTLILASVILAGVYQSEAFISAPAQLKVMILTSLANIRKALKRLTRDKHS